MGKIVMLKFTPAQWKSISHELSCITGLPEWLTEFLSLSHSEFSISVLQTKAEGHSITRVASGHTSMSIDNPFISQAYIGWLQEQIELCARGPEWNTVLEIRKTAIEPFAESRVIHLHIKHGDDLVSVYLFMEEVPRIFHHEVHLA